MKMIAAIIAMLLTLPISYAMLDVVIRKRLRGRMSAVWQTSDTPKREG